MHLRGQGGVGKSRLLREWLISAEKAKEQARADAPAQADPKRLLWSRWARLARKSPTQKRPHIALPPGTRLARATAFILTRDAYRKFVVPTIADMQFEYCDSLAAGRLWHARWIAIRGHLLVLPGCAYGLLARAVSRLLST